MLNLSNEVFNALSKYLRAQWSIEQFRDYMVGLRVDKYKLLPDVDRMFLNEFEGRYAEFSDFKNDEPLLRASLALYVMADDAATAPVVFGSWFLPKEQSTGTLSMTIGSSSPCGNFIPANTVYQPA